MVDKNELQEEIKRLQANIVFLKQQEKVFAHIPTFIDLIARNEQLIKDMGIMDMSFRSEYSKAIARIEELSGCGSLYAKIKTRAVLE